jgi:hypothetical protein
VSNVHGFVIILAKCARQIIYIVKVIEGVESACMGCKRAKEGKMQRNDLLCLIGKIMAGLGIPLIE